MKTIGENIRDFRIKIGVNQQDLANYCGISRELISMYETGKREVSLLHLEKISEYINVDLEVFLEENPEVIKPDLALVFRANDLSANDLESIAFFKQIVKNYLKMKKIECNGVED
ncbi:MAG: helix-turn-helix transcriptional regulator [Prolixibacteraceae bacterium]|jgi:transcriptional regulator with XRE-family HTH domain|nr:helix-turn-helix transcriptional regulator [Prolixibacteraceae bacterium]